MTGGRSTALLDVHRRLGARLVDFAGWQMPLQYRGIVAEHTAVRTRCGVFDVSHLGKLRVAGPRATAALDEAVTADVAALEHGAATYALVLADDGGCIDDVFVYRLGRAEWMVVPNAANVGAVAEQIELSGGDVADEWDRWAILAVQGPESYAVFERAFPGTAVADLRLHRFEAVDVGGGGIVARTGYTGERGVELYAPAPAAAEAFECLVAAGAEPCGLGARDTLRLEMGYALYGHELARDIDPLEAGLGWVIAWDTPFRGRDALRAVRERGPARRLFGVTCTERGVPRSGYRVLHGGEPVGTVTSGNHSPTLGTGIALALGPRAAIPDVGEKVAVEARGRAIAAVIVKPPFLRRDGRHVDK